MTPPLPNFSTVRQGNDKTLETMRSFKQSIVIRHGSRPTHSFIRRKLLLLLYKQKYPDSIEVGDDYIDMDIDIKIYQLKHKDRNPEPQSGDEVYYECLLRANFDENIALDILRNHRPDLVRLCV